MEEVNIKINGEDFSLKAGLSILEAAEVSDIYIPRLCSHPDVSSAQGMKVIGSVYQGAVEYITDNSLQEHEGCRLCVVGIEGEKELITSCNKTIEESMEIWTDTPDVKEYRREKMKNILSNHRHACLTCAQQKGCSREPCSTNVSLEERCCPEFGRCELQKVAEYIGIKEDTPRYIPQDLNVLDDEPLFIRNYELCIGCTRCVRICRDVMGVDALSFVFSNAKTIVGSIEPTLKESGCKFCGACVEVCPTGALSDKDILWAEREKNLVPCRDNCPLEADVPRYIRAIANRDYDQAVAVIREKTPFPSVLGRVCFHACEDSCRRSQINEPIAICALKRFALEHDSEAWELSKTSTPTSGKKIAVVGSGPTGLTAAFYLAKEGHSLTVFEAEADVGGMLNFGIPKYRLPREIFQKDLEHILNLGIEIRTEEIVGNEVSLSDLSSQGYEATFLAMGAQTANKLRIDGIELENVHWGLEFLKSIHSKPNMKVEDNIVVIGGGNVAMDVALTALRQGTDKVQIFCLESREEMPAHEWEIKEILDEGIDLNCSWGPHRIHGKDGKVSKIDLIKCTSVFNSKGVFNPIFDETITKSVDTDMIILAIGQKADLSGIGTRAKIETSPGGFIKINNNTLETSVPGVFAGGEVTEGPISVVEAIDLGRKAARSINKYLGGSGKIVGDITEDIAFNNWIGREEDFYDRKRVIMPSLSISDRLMSYDEIELGYNEEMAVEEAKRCLGCDLRLQISPVTFPPEKWIDLLEENLLNVPESEGAIQILDENKQIILIQGTQNLRSALEEQLRDNPKSCYFGYEEDPMYTKKESELLQQYMQEFGRMPEGNEDLDDDLF